MPYQHTGCGHLRYRNHLDNIAATFILPFFIHADFIGEIKFDEQGFLKELGAKDDAGCAVVHLCGGFSRLTITLTFEPSFN